MFTTAPSSQTIKIFSALLIVQVLFGINYLVSKEIVGIISPIVWADIRVIISTFALFGLAHFSGRPRPALDRQFFGPLCFYTLLGVVINQSSFLIGLRYTTATNSSVLNTLIPIFTLFFVTLMGKEQLTPRRALGFLSALAGVLIIRKIENFTFSDETLLGDSLTILNCMSYGLFLTLSKKFIEKYDSLWTTAWMFGLGGILLTLIAAPSWVDFQAPELNTHLVGAMLFSILGSTLFAYLLNIWALARTRSSSVAFFIYLQPIITSFLAWMVFNEPVTFRTLLAGFFIFAGMLLAIQRPKSKSDLKPHPVTDSND